MRKLLLLAHISLDGFVAGPHGELDGFPSGDENLGFINALTADADAAVFGRVSYELLETYWPTAAQNPGATANEVAYSNWYNAARKIVISSTLSGAGNTTVVRNDAAGQIAALKEQPGKNMLIFGSPSASQLLMREGLIDSYWIFVNPVLFGEGIPLFAPSTPKNKLRLLDTHRFANGEVGLNYVIDPHR